MDQPDYKSLLETEIKLFLGTPAGRELKERLATNVPSPRRTGEAHEMLADYARKEGWLECLEYIKSIQIPNLPQDGGFQFIDADRD